MKEIVTLQGSRVQVDDIDFEYVNQWTWYSSPKGYVHRIVYVNETREDIALHQVIGARMGISITPSVDHRNRIKTDCRRENLRTADQFEQQGNKGPNHNNKCGYRGVSKRKGYNKWRAILNRVELGHYDSPEDAARAYNKEALARYGVFAKLNEVSNG